LFEKRVFTREVGVSHAGGGVDEDGKRDFAGAIGIRRLREGQDYGSQHTGFEEKMAAARLAAPSPGSPGQRENEEKEYPGAFEGHAMGSWWFGANRVVEK
jgi:hypothetical protein